MALDQLHCLRRLLEHVGGGQKYRVMTAKPGNKQNHMKMKSPCGEAMLATVFRVLMQTTKSVFLCFEFMKSFCVSGIRTLFFSVLRGQSYFNAPYHLHGDGSEVAIIRDGLIVGLAVLTGPPWRSVQAVCTLSPLYI